MTGSTVWGASRAYRRECLDEIMPLERRMGWDGVDEFRANAAGLAHRDDSRPASSSTIGRRASATGQPHGRAQRKERPRGTSATGRGISLLRALHYAPKEPAALAMIGGYARAALSRRPQCADEVVRDYLRSQQAPGKLPARIAEALGRR